MIIVMEVNIMARRVILSTMMCGRYRVRYWRCGIDAILAMAKFRATANPSDAVCPDSMGGRDEIEMI